MGVDNYGLAASTMVPRADVSRASTLLEELLHHAQ
jgi:hypothetical protein